MGPLELLKLYPNKTGFFVGGAIGLCAYTVSKSLCVFASGCTNLNPFYPLAMFLGSLLAGVYCGWLVDGKSKPIVVIFVTLLTTSIVLQGGIRKFFDDMLGKETFVSYILLYGVVTLVFAVAITLLNKKTDST